MSLAGQLCFALYASQRAMTSCYRPLLDPLGLTHTQYLVMLLLWEHPSVTVGDLGRRLQLDSGTLSPLLARLERAGLARRGSDPDDERVVRVSVTGAGRALRNKAAGVPVQMAEATGMTSTEITDLRNTLQALIVRLRAAEPQSNPPQW